MQRRHDSLFVGSMILGVLAGAALVVAGSSTAGLLLGTGLCGALTTYSTLSYETARLIERRARLSAVTNLFGSIVAGLAAVTAGYLLGSAVPG